MTLHKSAPIVALGFALALFLAPTASATDTSCYAVVKDRAGNSYTTGETTKSGYYYDATVTSYNSVGRKRWMLALNNGKSPAINDMGRAVALDPTETYVYVTGQSFGGLWLNYNDARGEMFVAKLKASSGTLVWSKVFGDPGGADRGQVIQVDAAGNVYAAGYSYVANPVNGNNSWSSARITKFTPDGVQKWNFVVAGAIVPGYTTPRMAVDPSGNVTALARSSSGYLVARYDTNGVWQWDTGLRTDADIRALVLDAAGNPVVVGAKSDPITGVGHVALTRFDAATGVELMGATDDWGTLGEVALDVVNAPDGNLYAFVVTTTGTDESGNAIQNLRIGKYDATLMRAAASPAPGPVSQNGVGQVALDIDTTGALRSVCAGFRINGLDGLGAARFNPDLTPWASWTDTGYGVGIRSYPTGWGSNGGPGMKAIACDPQGNVVLVGNSRYNNAPTSFTIQYNLTGGSWVMRY